MLAGLSAMDDAAVYKLDNERALIMTADFFPPIVDDPYLYGAVAAANALSDVYAMGGEPLMAINLVGWPADVDAETLALVLKGGADKVAEAGAFLAGGHTVVDVEPKYGMAVAGLVKPDQILRKDGVEEGDVLVLTKPLGSGIISTALKTGQAAEIHVQACVDAMTALNHDAMYAARVMYPHVHAATDITGFGILGHAHEMATQSGCRFRLEWDRLPWIDGSVEYAKLKCFSAGGKRNSEFYSRWIDYDVELTDWQKMMLHDPQTSGGLLLAVEAGSAPGLLLALEARGRVGYIVGEAIEGTGSEVIVN